MAGKGCYPAPNAIIDMGPGRLIHAPLVLRLTGSGLATIQNLSVWNGAI